MGDVELAAAMLDGVRELGLTRTPSAARFLARVRLAPDEFAGFDEGTLLQELDDWLLPYLTGVTTSEAWRKFDITPALKARLKLGSTKQIGSLAPSHFTTPLGRKIPIDYDGEHPQIALRLQEMFGQVTHPQVVGKPLRVTLLSPAGRPVQTTLDIPGFGRQVMLMCAKTCVGDTQNIHGPKIQHRLIQHCVQNHAVRD